MDAKYDLAGHSLGTSYIMSEFKEHSSNIDQLFLFNPASSFMQSNDVLKEFANIENANYYLNAGDPIGSALLQNMSRDTLNARVFDGSYRYDPLSAHSLSQWYRDEINAADTAKTPEDVVPLEPSAEMLTDTPESRKAGLS